MPGSSDALELFVLEVGHCRETYRVTGLDVDKLHHISSACFLEMHYNASIAWGFARRSGAALRRVRPVCQP